MHPTAPAPAAHVRLPDGPDLPGPPPLTWGVAADDDGRPTGVIYLRLSDPDNELDLEGRADVLLAEAGRQGVRVVEVIVENDYSPGAGPGVVVGASAFVRKKIRLPNGRMALRTVRPGFRRLLRLMESGLVRYVFAEDLDRLLRQPRDNEDLLDAAEMSGCTVLSLSGSIRLTNGGDDNERFMARLMANVANKGSADTARRVRAARARHAGHSYGGGRRPFGFDPDPVALKHRKTLLHRPAEARELRKAAAAVLRQGMTLQAVARDWNGRGVRTVKGGPWNGSLVRDVLLKPAVAGLVYGPAGDDGVRPLLDAPWDAILERDVWGELRAYLSDPNRRCSTGNVPKWLVSVFAVCGKCGSRVRVSRAKPYPIYTCEARSCTSRKVGDMTNVSDAPTGVDDMVASLVVARLCEDDAADLARPAPTLPEAEAARLRAERGELVKRRQAQARMHAGGSLTDDALEAGAAVIALRLETIEGLLLLADAVDPLAEFRDSRPPAEVWAQLTVARRRAVVQLLVESVTILPVSRHGGRVFNPASVVVVPRSFS